MGVTIIGDSHSEVFGPLLVDRFRALGREAHATANRGWSVRTYLSRGVPGLETVRPGDTVIIELGGNDRPSDPAAYRTDLDRLVAAARQAGAGKILWVGPFTVGAHGDPRVQMSHAEARRLQSEHFRGSPRVTWIDGYPLSDGVRHAGDGLHFPRSSYEQIVERAMPELLSAEKGRRLSPLAFIIPGASVLVAGAIVYLTLQLGED